MIVHVERLPLPWPPFESNVYLIGSDDKRHWILIDTGFYSEEAEKKLFSFIQQNANGKLEGVVLTHGHPDHYGNAPFIKEVFSGVRFYVHEKDLFRVIHLEKEIRRKAAQLAGQYLIANGVPEDKLSVVSHQSKAYFTRKYQLIKEDVAPLNEKITLGDEVLEIYHVPGHTPGHVVLFHRESGFLFCGDHLYPKGVPVPLMYFPVPEERFRNFPCWYESLNVFERLKPRKVFPGHFDEFSNWRDVLQKVRKRTERKIAMVIDVLSHKALTVYELGLTLYPQIPEEFWSFSFAEAQGFLDFLEEQGKVRAEYDGKVYRYYLQL